MSEVQDVDRLIALFRDTFHASERTELVRGSGEPVYLPRALGRETAQVVFAHGFFASALHEIAHWCLAGQERRKLVDYGYWYHPDDRNATQQREFLQVEVRPQALEWILATAAGRPFHFSADNLSPGGVEDSAEWTDFKARVLAQCQAFLTAGLPPRGARIASALAATFGGDDRWRDASAYRLPGHNPSSLREMPRHQPDRRSSHS